MLINKNTRDAIKKDITTILYDRGEGFLDDEGVDEKVCEDVAEEIVKYLEAKYE